MSRAPSRSGPELSRRLRVFTDAGLIPTLPTPFQLRQGTAQMTPYVVSTDATTEEGYRLPFGHPIARQPLIFSQVGPDHVRTGSGLAVALSSLVTHLHLTYHRGMPVFDLQVAQTHVGGLDVLRQRTEALLSAGSSPRVRRHRRLAALILRDPEAYWRKFVDDGGWIDRASRLEYPEPSLEASGFPPEFFSLVGFINHCAKAFPADRADVPWFTLPAHYASLAGRRWRARSA